MSNDATTSTARDVASMHQWVARAAACWAVVFATLHLCWAAGYYVLLDPVRAAAAFSSPWMLAYDVVVAVMCIGAIPLALLLARPAGTRMSRRWWLPPAIIGTGLLVLRALASLVQVAYLAATGRLEVHSIGWSEPWFYLGATLFALDLWWHRQRHRRSMPAPGRATAP